MDIESVLSIAFFGAIVIFIIIMFKVAAYFEQKRRDDVKKIARMHGFSYNETGSIDDLSSIDVFNKGHSRKSKNMLQGSKNGRALKIMDYSYTVGYGRNSKNYHQTIFIFTLNSLVTKFSLGPEHFFHKIGVLFGYKDIDFDRFPEFSKKYLLKGPNEAEVRSLFSDSIIKYFENLQGKVINLEGNRDKLVFFRLNKRINPDDFNSVLNQAFEIVKLFDKEDY